MNLPPLPQQSIITDFILAHKEAAIFACPGVGKTRAVIDAVKEMLPDGAIRGVLIIAPLRVALLTWPDELEKWGGLTYANLRTEEGMRAWTEGTADVYLLNYEMLPQFIAKGMKGRKTFPADMVCWDESSKTRSHNSKRIKAFLPYRDKFRRHVGLTGTPQPNSCLDLWGQIRLLDGGKRLGPSFHAFRQRYSTSDYLGFKWEINPGSEEAIQEKIKDMTLVMRGEDWLTIPPVTYEDIEVTLAPDVMRGYKKLQKEMLIEIEKKEVVALSAASLVQKLAQYASGASYHTTDETRGVVSIHDEKIHALAALHKKIGYAPLLVFTQFIHEQDRIMKAIPQAQIFDGNRLDEWNAGRIPLWLVHPKSAAFGLQMQGSCHHVCWYSLGYSFEDYKQGNARVARTGQKNPTAIYRLIASQTVDWAMVETLRTKESGESALKSALKFIKKLANFS